MKRLFLLVSAVWALSACDEKAAPQAFTPEIASFSNEFEFDPLRGPVKEFTQTLFDEHDKAIKEVRARLSNEGCFDLIALDNREENTGGAWLLDANYYLDSETHEKRLRLQGKCQLAEMVSEGMKWEMDDNGFIVTSMGKKTTTSYRYDSEGFPLGKTTTAKDARYAVTLTPSADSRQKLNYSAVLVSDDNPVGSVQQTCEYDDYYNPTRCEQQMVDNSVQPPLTYHYTIKNTIEYY